LFIIIILLLVSAGNVEGGAARFFGMDEVLPLEDVDGACLTFSETTASVIMISLLVDEVACE
jgi:hypothetical protein